MTHAWERTHRRMQVLAEAMAAIEAQETPQVPWNDRVAAAFDSPDDLLASLHQRWLTRLSARIDLALERTGPGEGADAATAAWRDTERSMPGVRRLLDRYAGSPALRHGERIEHRLLMLACDSPPPTTASPGLRPAPAV